MADDEQFRAFVAGRSQALLATAYLLTRDWPLAEDLLQSALVRSWLSWRRITGSPEQYVRRVLLNEYLTWWRRRWRHEVPTEVLPELPAGPDQGAAVDARVAMWRLLGRLPRRQRAVLVLRYYEDLSEREIAEVLGCTAGTVKSQAAKALARLRAEPGGEHDREGTVMNPVDDELRELLRERAVPPAAPPDRYEVVVRRGRARRRRRVAGAAGAAALGVLAAVAVPAAVLRDPGPGPAAPPAAEASRPPASRLAPVGENVVAAGSQIKIGRIRGACEPESVGVAWLRDGSWRVAVWTPRPAGASPGAEDGVCATSAHPYVLRLPLPEPYAGQPVVDEATGRPVEVNGGPGARVPTYLPPGYVLEPGGEVAGELTLSGPRGLIMLRQGPREYGEPERDPTWFEVLDRPVIGGSRAVLGRYRGEPGNTILGWTDGDRGFAVQSLSVTLDPQELVRIARGLR